MYEIADESPVGLENYEIIIIDKQNVPHKNKQNMVPICLGGQTQVDGQKPKS